MSKHRGDRTYQRRSHGARTSHIDGPFDGDAATHPGGAVKTSSMSAEH
jgi:hypothetical protein